jgi:short subunit dehydrogenase-like uncharacterized protein
MTGKLIINSATGYTGQLVSERAKQAGLDFIVWPPGCRPRMGRATSAPVAVLMNSLCWQKVL